MTRKTGRIIALEGIDGAGKSTLADALANRLRARGRRVGRWREPTDAEVGARAAEANRDDPWSAAVLFTLDRSVHRPDLEDLLDRGDVIADRSNHSTLAYQGSALPPAARKTLERLQHKVAVKPAVVILLDLPPDAALRRVSARGAHRSPIERLATLRRVARAYRAAARRGGWVVLDARLPPDELVEAADRALLRRGFGAVRSRR